MVGIRQRSQTPVLRPAGQLRREAARNRTGELNARRVRIDIRAPSPFTTETVLEATAGIPVAGCRVLVQRYGEANRRLGEALGIPRRRGA